MTTTSESALLIGWRCASRLMAPATQIRPKTMNSIWWTIGLCSPGHDETGDNDVGNGQRQQKLPAEGHQLVIAEARQCATDPYIQKDEEENFEREPEHGQ